jgi:hypothetical protein
MFLGRTEEARAIYRAHVGEPLQDKKWENVIVEDFAKLRAAKLTNPLMAEIEAAFPPSPAPTATDSPTARSPAPSPTPTPSYTALATPEPSPSAETRAPTTYDNYDLAGKGMTSNTWPRTASRLAFPPVAIILFAGESLSTSGTIFVS